VTSFHPIYRSISSALLQLLKLIMLQVNAFWVFAIIGAVFAGIQVIVGSTGANNVFHRYMDSGCRNWEVSCLSLFCL